MATLQFGDWLWLWYERQPQDIREYFEKEIIGEDWLFSQPSKTQLEVLKGAPQDFINKVLPRLKPETAIALGINPFLRR